MKSTSFQALVVGALCLCTAGLAAVAVNQNRQLQNLQAKLQQEATASDYQHRWRELSDKQISTDATVTQLRSTVTAAASAQDEQAHRIGQISNDLKLLKDAPQPQVVDIDLQPLELRLSTIEEQLAKIRAQVAPLPAVKSVDTNDKKKPVSTSSPNPSMPPFAIMGSESRGPEQFLSLQPLGEQSLRSVRLIQLGETFAGWRLDNLNSSTAMFSNSSQATHTLAIPREAQ